MGVSQPIRDYDIEDPRFRQSTPLPQRSSVAMASRFLDAALRVWDEDQALAKSQIKVAADMLRGDTEDPPRRAKPAGSAVAGLLPWQARKVREFIDTSLGSKIRLQDCASRARLSANHFSRAFKATFGATVLGYIRRRRIEQAQHMMLTSRQPLSQIALSCGFADQSHYCRVFHAVVGVSPNAWRRQNMLEAPDEEARHDDDILSRPPARLGWDHAGQ
jgi:AraC family transcriptional regulator